MQSINTKWALPTSTELLHEATCKMFLAHCTSIGGHQIEGRFVQAKVLRKLSIVYRSAHWIFAVHHRLITALLSGKFDETTYLLFRQSHVMREQCLVELSNWDLTFVQDVHGEKRTVDVLPLVAELQC